MQWPLDAKLKADEAALQKYAESFKQWGMGVSTPHEMRTLMERIVTGKAGTPASSDEMHRLLNHQYKDSGIASQIPPSVVVACKSGHSERSSSDMAVVHSPSGTYALTIFITDVDDLKQRRRFNRSHEPCGGTIIRRARRSHRRRREVLEQMTIRALLAVLGIVGVQPLRAQDPFCAPGYLADSVAEQFDTH